MELPVENYVSGIDLEPSDAFLPLFETVVNAVISLKQTEGNFEKEIEIHLEREEANTGKTNLLNDFRPIKSIKVIDNGEGFNPENLKSYETAYSHKNKRFGCKGVGRFTILAAFETIEIDSIYVENNTHKAIKFDFDPVNEVKIREVLPSTDQRRRTIVTLKNLYNSKLRESTAKSIDNIAEELMNHCLIFYLCNDLPKIALYESGQDKPFLLSEKFESLKKDREREFNIGGELFNCYITKTERTGNRKNHYSYYCANSRVVGGGKSLANVNGLFMYPLLENGNHYFLDVYVVSEYLNKKVFSSRNGFSIPQDKPKLLFEDDYITFDDIDQRLVDILSQEYSDYAKDTQAQNIVKTRNYIAEKAPQYSRFLHRPDILNSVPANLAEDRLDEFLHKLAYKEKSRIDKKIKEFIEKQEVTEDSISVIKAELAEKNALDKDSLADYMSRRRAIIEIFKKFLDADRSGKYKLEKHLHNLIFPMGFNGEELDYHNHNLWLLDERFTTYHFIGSDTPICQMSQKESSEKPDITMFNNPISFASTPSGQLQSMVIFEFKRPGETAHNESKTNYRWDFEILIKKYFDEFLYGQDNRNQKGRQIIIEKNTPKFGYIVVDVIPPLLKEYNLDQGYKPTPFGTLFKPKPELNLHIEVVTFEQLIKAVEERHTPFFDKLFQR